jgi:hypothetical protein
MVRLLLLLAFLGAPAVASAQGAIPFPFPFDMRGTPEEQRACEPDAQKLCRHVINNDMAVLHCFQQQRQKLSRACLAVLERYGQ